MTSSPVIRGTNRAELLDIPALMMGFHPADSCVLLGLSGVRVKFCARLDLDWFVEDFDRVAEQVQAAADNVDTCRFVLLGYCTDPELAGLGVSELMDVVGVSNVHDALLTDGERYWSLLDGEGPCPVEPNSSVVAAQAVYQGINISHTREEAIAPVTMRQVPSTELCAAVSAEVAALPDGEAMDLLATLAEADQPLSQSDALRLAMLLADEERTAALLARLSVDNAGTIWPNLSAARAAAPDQHEADVLALLGMASWLSGRGAAHTSCLQQLGHRATSHPVGALLNRVHQLGIPPSRWDE